MDIGPHPHNGLQTVTWLINGQVLHRRQPGSEQVIKPGQLNLMRPRRPAGGETAQRIAVLPAWRHTALFSAKE